MTKPIKHLQMFKLEDMNVQQDLGPNFDPLKLRPPSFTIHVAPRGSYIYDDKGHKTGKTSDFGHTYMTVSGLNPATGKYEQTSIGLSPGEDWGSSKDNLSFNDHIRYKDASTLTILSNSERFRNDLNNLLMSLMIIDLEKLCRQTITLSV